MKNFTLIISFLLAVTSISYAQNRVVDTHPNSSIFAIDYSTGQETLATFDAAILFKDALIELVSNTTIARMQVFPGRKNFVITQMDPQTNGNAYQLILQNRFLNQTNTLYTFVYSVDQNSLSFYNVQTQSYMPVTIQGVNLNNLNNCFAYGKFNAQDAAAAPQTAVDASADADNAPVDTAVTATAVPPALPDYDQPECPVDGYLWQPGYWAYSPDSNGYYWVPGAWVAPPSVGLLWTPPYWGFDGGVYVFHTGYWGNHIGFYGGVNYGYGYGGVGFVGGDWHEGHFRYNTAVVRVNTTVIHNTYVDRSVIVDHGERNRASFNGRGGIMARPNDHEMAAMHERHLMATAEQNRNQQIARADRSQFASANGGRPGSLAAAKVPAGRPNINAGQRAFGNTGSTGTRPGAPGSIGTKPGMPGSTVAKPGMPGSTGGKPGVPGSIGTVPGVPRAPNAFGTKPGAPGTPGKPGSIKSVAKPVSKTNTKKKS